KEVGAYRELTRLALENKRPDWPEAALRRGLQEAPDQLDLKLAWAALMIEGGKLVEAREAVDALRHLRTIPVERLDFLDASYHAARGEWREAVKKLEGGRALAASSPDQLRRGGAPPC